MESRSALGLSANYARPACSRSSPRAATHGFLPLAGKYPEAVRAQVLIGCDHLPRDIWRATRRFLAAGMRLSPGLEKILQEANLRWFILDAHGLDVCEAAPALRDLRAVLHAGRSGGFRARSANRAARSGARRQAIRAIRRIAISTATSVSICRPRSCFPGRATGRRRFTGLKYHRITGARRRERQSTIAPGPRSRGAGARGAFHRSAPPAARGTSDAACRSDRGRGRSTPSSSAIGGSKGRDFLEHFIRAGRVPFATNFSSRRRAIIWRQHATQEVVAPAASSWGENGYWEVWLDESNSWIYPAPARGRAADDGNRARTSRPRRTRGPNAATARARAAARAIKRLGVPDSNRNREALRRNPDCSIT